MHQASASQYMKCESHCACCAASCQSASLSSCVPCASTTSLWERATQQSACICCRHPAAVLPQGPLAYSRLTPQDPDQGAGRLSAFCNFALELPATSADSALPLQHWLPQQMLVLHIAGCLALSGCSATSPGCLPPSSDCLPPSLGLPLGNAALGRPHNRLTCGVEGSQNATWSDPCAHACPCCVSGAYPCPSCRRMQQAGWSPALLLGRMQACTCKLRHLRSCCQQRLLCLHSGQHAQSSESMLVSLAVAVAKQAAYPPLPPLELPVSRPSSWDTCTQRRAQQWNMRSGLDLSTHGRQAAHSPGRSCSSWLVAGCPSRLRGGCSDALRCKPNLVRRTTGLVSVHSHSGRGSRQL